MTVGCSQRKFLFLASLVLLCVLCFSHSALADSTKEKQESAPISPPPLPRFPPLYFGMPLSEFLRYAYRFPGFASPVPVSSSIPLKQFNLHKTFPLFPGFGVAPSPGVFFKKRPGSADDWYLCSIAGEHTLTVASAGDADLWIKARLAGIQKVYGKPTRTDGAGTYEWDFSQYHVQYSGMYIPPPLNKVMLIFQINGPTH